MMNKFRASYSTLSLWASGNTDRAIEGYFKLSTFDTPALEAGRKWHEQWQYEVEQTKSLPKIFGGKQLQNPITEQKIVKEIDTWLDLVGVIDLQDEDLLIDYKTGKTPSSYYANTYQANLYQILIPTAKRFEYHHYDQYKKSVDMTIIHLSEQTLDNGIEWLLTYASDMHSYLIENNLYEQYDHK
jgi:hypothetical protein